MACICMSRLSIAHTGGSSSRLAKPGKRPVFVADHLSSSSSSSAFAGARASLAARGIMRRDPFIARVLSGTQRRLKLVTSEKLFAGARGRPASRFVWILLARRGWDRALRPLPPGDGCDCGRGRCANAVFYFTQTTSTIPVVVVVVVEDIAARQDVRPKGVGRRRRGGMGNAESAEGGSTGRRANREASYLI